MSTTIDPKTTKALKHLKNYKKHLTPQQYSTLKGQIFAGNIDGAIRGLKRLMARKKAENEKLQNGKQGNDSRRVHNVCEPGVPMEP